MDYMALSAAEWQQEYDKVSAEYESWKAKGLKLNMARGKPSKQQLDLVSGILTALTSAEECVDSGVDARNYGELEGLSEARALLLLQENGIIKLRDGAGITATKNDIVENPYNVEIVEAEAARLPDMLKDADYAVINSNYAINAGLNPVKDSLAIEGSSSAYANILAVKEGNENTPKILALKAALESRQVASFIQSKYNGSVVSTVTNPGNGYDDSVDYDALKGQTITVAASPTPHAEILEVAKEILAAKDITLDIQVYNDYVVPNTVVDDGTLDANYFQHLPYLEDFNAENNTHIVSVSAIHVEPMGLYGGLQTSLDALKASK